MRSIVKCSFVHVIIFFNIKKVLFFYRLYISTRRSSTEKLTYLHRANKTKNVCANRKIKLREHNSHKYDPFCLPIYDNEHVVGFFETP